MDHIIILALIMVVGGVVGGCGSYLATDVSPDEQRPLVKRVALGIAAALVVPLFLNMISSSILANSEQAPTNYLVFGGFCIVAAFSSKAFLTSVSKKLLDRVETVEQKQAELVSDVEPIIDKETEPEPEEPTPELHIDVSDDEMRVLRALANPVYSRRFVNGIASESSLSDVNVVYHLLSLREKGLVESKRGKRKDIFWLTSLGRDFLRFFAESSDAV